MDAGDDGDEGILADGGEEERCGDRGGEAEEG